MWISDSLGVFSDIPIQIAKNKIQDFLRKNRSFSRNLPTELVVFFFVPNSPGWKRCIHCCEALWGAVRLPHVPLVGLVAMDSPRAGQALGQSTKNTTIEVGGGFSDWGLRWNAFKWWTKEVVKKKRTNKLRSFEMSFTCKSPRKEHFIALLVRSLVTQLMLLNLRTHPSCLFGIPLRRWQTPWLLKEHWPDTCHRHLRRKGSFLLLFFTKGFLDATHIFFLRGMSRAHVSSWFREWSLNWEGTKYMCCRRLGEEWLSEIILIQSLDSSKIHRPYKGSIMKFHWIRILAANPRLVLPEEGKKAQRIRPTRCWSCFKWAHCHEDDCLIQSYNPWGNCYEVNDTHHNDQWEMQH